MLPHPQQGAVEQDRRGVWVWGHAGWYADPPISGNPGSASRARGGRENYRWDKALSISMPNESKYTLKRYFSVHPLRVSLLVWPQKKPKPTVFRLRWRSPPSAIWK